MQRRTKRTVRSHTTLTLAAAVLLAGALPSARGQAASTTNSVPKPVLWDTSASAGLTLTRGNSRTLLATIGVDTKRKWDQNEASLGLAGGYGSDNGVNNNKYVNGFAQYNRLFSERLYAGVRLDGSYDGIAGLDHRLSLSPLVGYYAVKETNTSLCFEVGPSAVTEKHEGESEDSYLGFRASERLDHKLSATTKIWESVSYVPEVDKWADKYVITAEAGIDAAITKQWSLRVVLQDIYDSQPTTGREKNDVRLVAGTAYKF